MSPSYSEGEAARVIVERLRAELLAIATRSAATLRETSAELMSDPVRVFTLSSNAPNTASIEVVAVGAWSIYLVVGEAGNIEVLASPETRNEASLILFPSSGDCRRTAEREPRAETRRWKSRWIRAGVRLDQDGPWSIIGEVGAVAPLIGRLLTVAKSFTMRPSQALTIMVLRPACEPCARPPAEVG